MSNIIKGMLRTLTVLLIVLLVTVVPSSTEAEEPPYPPPSIYLMATPYGDDIMVTWDQVPQDDVYGVYALDLTRVDSEDWYNRTVIAQLAPGTSSYLDGDVVPRVIYHYRLMVLSNNDHSAYKYWTSTEVRIRTDAVVPAPPYGLKATSGGSEVNLTWEVPLDDGGGTVYNYTVYMGSNATQLAPVMNVRSHEHYQNGGCTVHNLTNGQVYFFAVQAMNSVGGSNLSEVVWARPLPSPQLTVNCKEMSWGHFNISVSWSPPEPGCGTVVGYILYIDGLAMNTIALERGPEERSYGHELHPFGEYLVYRVAAIYDDGNVSYSNAIDLQFAMYEGIGIDLSGYVLVGAVVLVMAAAAVITWSVSSRERKK